MGVSFRSRSGDLDGTGVGGLDPYNNATHLAVASGAIPRRHRYFPYLSTRLLKRSSRWNTRVANPLEVRRYRVTKRAPITPLAYGRDAEG